MLMERLHKLSESAKLVGMYIKNIPSLVSPCGEIDY